MGIFGAKFAVWGGLYGFVAPGLSYMLVGTGGGAAHVCWSPYAGLATVDVVAMFASYCACCPTVVRRAVISCAILEIFLFNSLVLALDAWVRLARVFCSVVILLLSLFSYALAAPWYGLPQLFPDWRRIMYASAKWFLNSAQFFFPWGTLGIPKWRWDIVLCVGLR